MFAATNGIAQMAIRTVPTRATLLAMLTGLLAVTPASAQTGKIELIGQHQQRIYKGKKAGCTLKVKLANRTGRDVRDFVIVPLPRPLDGTRSVNQSLYKSMTKSLNFARFGLSADCAKRRFKSIGVLRCRYQNRQKCVNDVSVKIINEVSILKVGN